MSETNDPHDTPETAHTNGAGDGIEPAPPPRPKRPSPRRRWLGVPLVIGVGVIVLVILGELLFRHAGAGINHTALAAAPKPVTAVAARPAQYRASRRYVGTLEPWVAAKVGPQLVSAYVATVLVRPGAMVHQHDVIATLDCREASEAQKALAEQARSLSARQVALASQADRMGGLVPGGFVAANEFDQRRAESDSEAAHVLATRAQAAGSALVVDDCILRAPFDGEVGDRYMDPGAFVRPGSAIVAVVDRSVVRVTTDVPETDFAVVAPGTPVRMTLLATGGKLDGKVARRSPAADPSTRTVHIEIDVPDPERALPVNTTAEIRVDVGEPVSAEEIPLIGADVTRGKARVFVVETVVEPDTKDTKDAQTGEVVHRKSFAVLGESGGSLFVDPQLGDGAEVVTEGRSLLVDGDRVAATLAPKDGQ